jgi:hypothetical protein
LLTHVVNMCQKPDRNKLTEYDWRRLPEIDKSLADLRVRRRMFYQTLVHRLRLFKFNLLKPTGYGMHQQVEYFNNCTLCSHCICVLYLSENKQRHVSFTLKNWLVL